MPYRFGPFTLDPGTRRLLRDADEIHLSPKAFELLHFLIDDRARAIPRAELAPVYAKFTEGFGRPLLVEAKALLEALSR